MHQDTRNVRPFRTLSLGVGLAMVLAACSNSETTMTRSFGQGTNTVDEQRITSRPPLSLPPEYTLRPERPGVVRPVSAPPTSQQAASGPVSAGHAALLDAAGPAASPDIRARVNEDAQMESASNGFTDELMTFQRPPDQPAVIQRGSSSSGGFLSRLF
jgi:hypothetical protein